jgi:hypothetical protein
VATPIVWIHSCLSLQVRSQGEKDTERSVRWPVLFPKMFYTCEYRQILVCSTISLESRVCLKIKKILGMSDNHLPNIHDPSEKCRFCSGPEPYSPYYYQESPVPRHDIRFQNSILREWLTPHDGPFA